MTDVTRFRNVGHIDSDDDVSGLVLTLKGLILVLPILEARGASEQELAEHRRAIDRALERLGQIVNTQVAAA